MEGQGQILPYIDLPGTHGLALRVTYTDNAQFAELSRNVRAGIALEELTVQTVSGIMDLKSFGEVSLSLNDLRLYLNSPDVREQLVARFLPRYKQPVEGYGWYVHICATGLTPRIAHASIICGSESLVALVKHVLAKE